MDRPDGVKIAVAVGATVLVGSCNLYTPDMLLASAGGASARGTGASGGSTVHVATEGGRVGTSAFEQSSDLEGGATSWATASHQGGVGNSSSAERGGADATTAGGTDGADGDRSTEDDTSKGDAGGADAGGAAAWGAGGAAWAEAGAATHIDAAGAGGSTARTCWLDRMREPSAPIAHCDSAGTSYWYTFLPSGMGGSKATLEPLPSSAFEREPLSTEGSDEEIRVATGAGYKATMRGQMSSVVDQDAGIGFKLGSAAFSVRGATLNFYYRAQYSSPNKVLRVTIPCNTTARRPEGTCTINCGNHYGYELPNTNGSWTLRSVRLDTTENGGSLRQLEGWGPYPWNGDAALAIEFDVRKYAEHFEVSIGPIWLTWPSADGL